MISRIRRPIDSVRLGEYSIATIARAFRPDRRSIAFAIRTSAAALLALAVSTLFGFHEAYWSAVTAWVLAVPGRGPVLWKGLYRTLGTLIGAATAFALLPLAVTPTLLILALSVWVGTCAFVASLFRRFQAYAAQLSGYTAVLVAVVAVQYPHGPTFDLAMERVGLVLIGIIVATLLAWCFGESADESALRGQARQWAAQAARWAAAVLARTDEASDDIAPNSDLWVGLSDFESTCEYAAIESSNVRRWLPALRRLAASELSLISTVRTLRRFGAPADFGGLASLTDRLSRIADAYGEGRDPGDEIAAIRAAALHLSETTRGDATHLVAQAAGSRALKIADQLDHMRHDLAVLADQVPPHDPVPLPPMAILRDPRAGIAIGVRCFVATLVVGLLWLHVHWIGGAFAFILTSVASTLFGVLPRPSVGLQRFSIGITATVLAFALWHLVPGAGSFGIGPTLAVVSVCTFVAAIGLANRFQPSMDFNANFTALMLGSGPAHVSFLPAASEGMGLLVGIAVTFVAFSTLRSGPAQRAKRLDAVMTQTLKRIARGDWQPSVHEWEAVSCELLSRSTQVGSRRRPSGQALRHCLLALDIGVELLQLRTHARQNETPYGVSRVIDRALEDFARSPAVTEATPTMNAAVERLLDLVREHPATAPSAMPSAGALEAIARCCASWHRL